MDRRGAALLAHAVGALQMAHHLAANGGPDHFRRSTSCNIDLSRVISATSRFSFAFSSSSCFSRRISATPIPANCFFHR
jgi:hypothetical protein